MKTVMSCIYVISLATLDFSCDPNRYSREYAIVGEAEAQLRLVKGEISTTLLELQADGHQPDLKAALSKIVREKGIDFLRSKIATNAFLKIYSGSWIDKNGSGEIAVYDPEIVFDPETKARVMLARDFSANTIRLQKAPSWTPYPIGDLAQ